MTVAEHVSIYRSLEDRALERELQALERRVSVFKFTTTPAGQRLHAEFQKRLDQVRAEIERRAM